MSYRKHHIKSKIQKIKTRRPIFARPWFWMLFFILAIVFSGAYFALFYSYFQVSNILIYGNNNIGLQDLQSRVSEKINIYLIDTGFLKLTTSSIFLANTSQISQSLLQEFPAVKEAKVKKIFPNTISLEVVERQPMAVYFSEQGASQEYFLMDSGGVIFNQIDSPEPDDTIVRQTDKPQPAHLGQRAIAENIAGSIDKIKRALKDNFSIDLKEVLITSPLRMNFKTSENWQIYFNIGPDSDPNSQITKLNLLLAEEISQEERRGLEYIDLRFKDRAFYK